MPPCWVGVSLDPDIVRRIEKRGIDLGAFADDPPQKFGVACIATSDPVLAKNPDVTRLRLRCRRSRRDDLIVGIGGFRKEDVDLAGREAGERRINIEVDRGELAEFLLQDFQIPAGIERDLVVGDPQCPLLGLDSPDKVIVGTWAISRALAACSRP